MAITNDPANKNDNEQKPIPIKVEVNVGPKGWRQRGEIIGLGMVATAAGTGIVQFINHAVAKKAVDEGLRHAASFAVTAVTSLFG
jgi:hypothetical protein